MSEPMTQASLNSIHVKGGKQKIKRSGVGRIKEILSAKIKEKARDPMMTIPLVLGTTIGTALEIKNRIEKITVADIMSSADILYEKPSLPLNRAFAGDRETIASSLKI